jgi:predicted dinucleotide-binding enzyme
MRIGIVGAGRIGGGIARQLAAARHEVKLSFSRDPAGLEGLASDIGRNVTAGTPAEATSFGEVVVISVPWSLLPRLNRQDRSLARP